MLTGIEQYHWERAGYFIRRSYLDEDTVLAFRGNQDLVVDEVREIVGSLIADLLGQPPEVVGKETGVVGPDCWKRTEAGSGYSEGHGALASMPEGVVLRVAFIPDETMQVLPGSHTAPLTGDEIIQLLGNPLATLPGAVRVRLAPGDALFYHTALLFITQSNTNEDVLEIRFRKYRG